MDRVLVKLLVVEVSGKLGVVRARNDVAGKAELERNEQVNFDQDGPHSSPHLAFVGGHAGIMPGVPVHAHVHGKTDGDAEQGRSTEHGFVLAEKLGAVMNIHGLHLVEPGLGVVAEREALGGTRSEKVKHFEGIAHVSR